MLFHLGISCSILLLLPFVSSLQRHLLARGCFRRTAGLLVFPRYLQRQLFDVWYTLATFAFSALTLLVGRRNTTMTTTTTTNTTTITTKHTTNTPTRPTIPDRTVGRTLHFRKPSLFGCRFLHLEHTPAKRRQCINSTVISTSPETLSVPALIPGHCSVVNTS